MLRGAFACCLLLLARSYWLPSEATRSLGQRRSERKEELLQGRSLRARRMFGRHQRRALGQR
eukprot:4080395-Prorocentrum_lima.AAC.1